jgi:hypothetical protein
MNVEAVLDAVIDRVRTPKVFSPHPNPLPEGEGIISSKSSLPLGEIE